MKATGIVRKIDDLGRVVIPKELRKNLRLREGDPLEIFVENDGDLVLKKYAPMGEIIKIVEQYVETLSNISEFVACVSDTEKIIAIYGVPKENISLYLKKELSDHIFNVMEERKIWSTKEDRPEKLVADDKNKLKYSAQVIAPIICDADAIGSVILFSLDRNKKVTEVECKLARTAAEFLGKQMDLNG